jgi:hypothetical protein
MCTGLIVLMFLLRLILYSKSWNFYSSYGTLKGQIRTATDIQTDTFLSKVKLHPYRLNILYRNTGI